MIPAEIIFWIAFAGLLHSYVLFPVLIRVFALRKEPLRTCWESEELPEITIIIPAFNEEEHIREKLESVFTSDYPSRRIKVIVGSDHSTDATDRIVASMTNAHPELELVSFEKRTGKIGIINRLVPAAVTSIIVLSDANIIFERDTLRHLVKHFKDEQIGLVDSNMFNRVKYISGIGRQEKTYIRSEVGTKNAEGKIWGCMMGPFGGCYAIRKSLYSPVPANFLVDDFYINMKVLQQGRKCINEKASIVYEDATESLSEEFRRKIRIATGNYQNLLTFFPMLLRFDAISFCFFSHKVLRWKGPFLMILAFVCLLFLTWNNFFPGLEYAGMYHYVLYFAAGTILLPLIEMAYSGFMLSAYLLHFYSMNLALLIGFFKFLSGVRSSVWQPTRRNPLP